MQCAEICGNACIDIAEAKYFGSKSNDMGNEMTAFSVLDFVTPAEVIEKIQESMKGR